MLKMKIREAISDCYDNNTNFEAEILRFVLSAIPRQLAHSVRSVDQSVKADILSSIFRKWQTDSLLDLPHDLNNLVRLISIYSEC